MADEKPLPEGTVDDSIFEGLFRRSLKPEGAFAEALIAVGYDGKHPKRKYSSKVLRDALDVACTFVFPNLSHEQALQRLGEMFIEGFYGTIIGKFITATLPFLSAEMVIKRIPKMAAMSASGMEISVEDEAPGVWRVTWRMQHAMPEFNLGLFQVGMKKSNFGSVELVEKGPERFTLRFRATGK